MHSFVLFDVCIDSEADRHSDAGFRNELVLTEH
jgi:CRISPR/Cas system-associated protein endoribonuclease Cas2